MLMLTHLFAEQFDIFFKTIRSPRTIEKCIQPGRDIRELTLYVSVVQQGTHFCKEMHTNKSIFYKSNGGNGTLYIKDNDVVRCTGHISFEREERAERPEFPKQITFSFSHPHIIFLFLSYPHVRT